MKINDIFESTTSGSVATVAMPIGGTQKREGTLFKGKKTKKKFYEGKVKELMQDLKELSDEEFKKKYKKTKQEWRQALKEDEVNEADLILVPGHGNKVKPGFIPKDQDRTDHEVEMARSDLFHAAQNAKEVYKMIQQVSEEEGLEGWVQEKIIKANDYLNTVREYLEHKTYMQEGGVIAGGMSNFEEGQLDELKKSTINDYLSKQSAAVRFGKEEKPKKVPSWKVAAGKVNPDSEMGKYAKIKAGDLQGVAEGDIVSLKDNPATLKRLAKQWWNGNEQQHVHAQQMLEKMGWDIYEDDDNIVLSKDDQEHILPMDDLQGVTEGSEILKAGTAVRVPHKGKMVPGKIIRYDSGKGGESPAYVVDIGEYESKIVPVHNMKQGAAEDQVDEEKDACYNKVKSRYKVWPSAYASGALVKCRKVGASNWGNSSKK